jgi:hypothetical protein
VGGNFSEGEERVLIFRVFCVLSIVQNCQLPLCVSCGPIFIGKMLLGPQNWSLNFFFFCKFDFS